MNNTKQHPSTQMVVIGVTGTNGKTTVTHLLGTALKSAGYNPYVLGTLNSGSHDLSTPVAQDIKRKMAEHLAQGGTHFVMEVTSEGIDQGRVDEVDFDIKVLTNITQDHLDYHKTFSAYQQVKLRFMATGDNYKVYPKDLDKLDVDFEPRLLGAFNLLNIKAAMLVLRHLGIAEPVIAQALSACPPPKGRMDCVASQGQMKVFIDYAHTPDALKNALDATKALAERQGGRTLVMFGCGGDRDNDKRPKMALCAAERASHIVITDDNPRSECRAKIVSDIVAGIPSGFERYSVINNRREAIKHIIAMANENDIVLLAGKGHEHYQIIGGDTHYFNETEEVKQAMMLKAPAAEPEMA